MANQTVDQIFTSLGLWKWWQQNSGQGTNVFNGVSEKGIDYSAAWGTPIGAIAGGKVVTIEHNKNAINDIVQILDNNGGLWLYQHINAKVSVGQTIGVGTVVGTENGLTPSGGLDQYTTGPHIEVRHASTYAPGVNSWFQNWTNPMTNFATAGAGAATGSGSSPCDMLPEPLKTQCNSLFNQAGLSAGAATAAVSTADPLGIGGINSFFTTMNNANWKDIGIRTALITGGAIVIILGIYLFLKG